MILHNHEFCSPRPQFCFWHKFTTHPSIPSICLHTCLSVCLQVCMYVQHLSIYLCASLCAFSPPTLQFNRPSTCPVVHLKGTVQWKTFLGKLSLWVPYIKPMGALYIDLLVKKEALNVCKNNFLSLYRNPGLCIEGRCL